MDNKMIIYKENGIICVTDINNYNSPIQDARKIQRLKDFDTPQEVVEYYNKYFGPTEFLIVRPDFE